MIFLTVMEVGRDQAALATTQSEKLCLTISKFSSLKYNIKDFCINLLIHHCAVKRPADEIGL